jgi:hypothetical protein
MMVNNVPALPFLTVPQASAMYGIAANVITDAVRKGKLPSLNQPAEGKKRTDWRLDPRSVEVWVEKRKLDAERIALKRQQKQVRRRRDLEPSTSTDTSAGNLLLDEMRKQTALLQRLVESMDNRVGQMQEFNQLFAAQTERIASSVATAIKNTIG